MSSEDRERLDQQVRSLLEQGNLAGAASATLRGYGPEIFGFLMSLHRREQDADEVFALASEHVWRGLSEFGWQCSLRTWTYSVARNASNNFFRNQKRRARRQTALPEGSELADIVAEARSKTRTYMRSETKDQFARLRESLPAEERELLVLRVDRGLEWEELAVVLAGEESPLDPAELARAAARLRKRFQLLKKKLVELGRREGLLPNPAEDP
jgi:RNA polymerase sigma-70 factor (ECF subfamily)